ncbi:hypothetical protein MTO96_022538 [Rhipicephalus appendiculatus]
MAIIMYNINNSSPCSFIRSLAMKLGVELELKNLDFFKKEHLKPEYLKINPFHKAPALDDSGFIVYESTLQSLELYPEDVKQRTRIDQVLAAVSSTIMPHKIVFLRPLMYEKKKPTSEEVASFEEIVLRGFEHLIGDGKFAVGDQFTLADLCLFSCMVGILEMGFFDKNKFPKLWSYYERTQPLITGFDEIYKPGISILQKRWLDAK